MFAPLDYNEVAEACKEMKLDMTIPSKEDFARQHLAEHHLVRFPVDRALMVDGGILDNKPFSHVTKSIERKPARHEVYRVVVFVEPDPEHTVDKPPAHFPHPLSVATKLFKLFRHEPIYDDLERLHDRNSTVNDILKLLEDNQEDARRAAHEAGKAACPELDWPPKPQDAKSWRAATNSYAARTTMSGYAGYVVLKTRRVARDLADLICQAFNYPPPSRQASFIRNLVPAWLEGKRLFLPPKYKEGEGYKLDDEQLAFLRAFDVSFDLRRLRTLTRSTIKAYGTDGRGALNSFKRTLASAIFAYETKRDDLRAAIHNSFGKGVLETAVDTAIENSEINNFIGEHEVALEKTLNNLSERFRNRGKDQNERIESALIKLPEENAKSIMESFVMFPFVDVIVFPLMTVAGVEDLIDIKVMRISPYDIENSGNTYSALGGAQLSGCAGFLDRDIRERDLHRGRLDGARRLLTLIKNAASDEGYDQEKNNKIKDICDTDLERIIKTIDGVSS